jgi:hypothetical protein
MDIPTIYVKNGVNSTAFLNINKIILISSMRTGCGQRNDAYIEIEQGKRAITRRMDKINIISNYIKIM